MAGVYAPLQDRPLKDTMCLFDVDGTLTPARGSVTPEILQMLSALRHKCAIGFVRFPPIPLSPHPVHITIHL